MRGLVERILILMALTIVLTVMHLKLKAWNDCRAYGFSRAFCIGVSR